MTSYLRKTDPEYRRALEVAEEVIRTHAERGETLTYGALGDAIASVTGKRIAREQEKVFTWARTGERNVRGDPERARQIAEENRRRRGPI